ncbi:tRNA lysidine(34) synthetase TilS [Clostridium sp. B9]|uniref:tRNA lysidine(34) synthetase TilS n=1 Tax=Clostridium sp. B9 TaxID=3423224 RepID=UPI003D2F42A5
MKKKVIEFIKENSMIQSGDKVLVALSGGPDSVCLLHILSELRELLHIEVYAAHVNHCLRGESALGDEAYVEELCKKLNIKCFVKRVDINKISEERNISTEMAGREERYSFFEELKEKYSLDKIAIAHNANDQAETLIMRALRGTGIEGLVGIRPVRDEIFIRPILVLRRNEIEEYCEENKLNPRIDETNLEEIYSRNKIRLKAIPFIQENFNPDIVTTLNRLAYSCSKDVEFIQEEVEKRYPKLCSKEGKSIVIDEKAFEEKEAILTRIIKKALVEVSAKYNNFELKHIHDIISLKGRGTGKRVNITNGVIAINEYGKIRITLVEKVKVKEEKVLNLSNIKKELDENNKVVIEDKILGNYELIVEDFKKGEKFSKDRFIKSFDYDKISSIDIRFRQNGDKIIPLGMKSSKKLKDIFINNKIPKEERDFIPLVLFNNEIAWIVGSNVSETFKVTNKTKKVIKITFKGKEN